MRARSLLTAFWTETKGPWPRRFGVSAYSVEDALHILSAAGLEVSPDSAAVQPDICLADLDPDHVVPNMGVIALRGVWYPNLSGSDPRAMR